MYSLYNSNVFLKRVASGLSLSKVVAWPNLFCKGMYLLSASLCLSSFLSLGASLSLFLSVFFSLSLLLSRFPLFFHYVHTFSLSLYVYLCLSAILFTSICPCAILFLFGLSVLYHFLRNVE